MSKLHAELESILSFIKELERLKQMTRTAWTSTGRQESVAEHSWRLAIFALALKDYFPDYDLAKVLQLCLLHDLGEALEGDVSAKIQRDPAEKQQIEEHAVHTLTASLPKPLRDHLVGVWQEYERGETREARLVKALDKMETIVQHNQGDNPVDFDYAFNLAYGRTLSRFDAVLTLLRDAIDRETQQNINSSNDT